MQSGEVNTPATAAEKTIHGDPNVPADQAREFDSGHPKASQSADEENDEESLKSSFLQCEEVVQAVLNYKYEGNEKNTKLRACIEKLQSIIKVLEKISAFSNNEDADEMSTQTLHFLVVPAYLAFCAEEMFTGRESRSAHLLFAKRWYRNFLEKMMFYRLTNLRAPWRDSENDDDDGGEDEPKNGRSSRTERQIAAVDHRAEKIALFAQRDQLEKALEELRLQRRPGSDEALEREIVITLLRLWACRASSSFASIEEELKLLDFGRTNDAAKQPPVPKAPAAAPFIIAKNEAQKAVFGLGYPSVPTCTVDEWYDQMMAKKGFSAFPSKPTTTTGEDGGGRSSEDDGEGDDEATREAKRQRAVQQDEWRDTHRRGWGNTHNKG